MITRVRIAPADRWCAPVLEWLTGERLDAGRNVVGTYVLIDTAKMREQYEGLHGAVTKFWFVLPESQQECVDRSGAVAFGGDGGWICEHMLELD
jgi:hypothetical protein